MSEKTKASWPVELVIEVGASRGLALDRERAEALRAPLESLLSRLSRLARSIPADTAPSPTPRRGERSGS